MSNDAERIELLQTRIARFEDQKAYRELFTTLYPTLYHFNLRLYPFQRNFRRDHFRRIYQDLAETQGPGVHPPAESLLFCDGPRTCPSTSSKNKNACTSSRLDDFSDAGQEFTSAYKDPEQLMITDEMLHRIAKAVDSLPLKCRMIFRLVKEEGFRYKEAAEIMNISEKTVENQLAIAVKKIGKSIHFDINSAVALG